MPEGRAADNRWHQCKDGSRFWANGAMLPMRAPSGGAAVGLVKILRDETPMREATEALERTRAQAEAAQAKAEAAGAAKDHFLAVLSHCRDLPEAVTRTFAMIKRNVELEARFIDDLLDVTRIAHGKMEIVRADMDLHEAVRRAVEVSTPDIAARNQQLTVTLEGDTCSFHGDLARLQQVFWNLLKNASKFTPKDGPIEIRSRCGAGEPLIVEASVSGIGLEAEAVERIFRPFEQASVSVTREFGELGLGLAIAKATGEAHGGTLRASSPGLGQGATFMVSLPLTSAPETVA